MKARLVISGRRLDVGDQGMTTNVPIEPNLSFSDNEGAVAAAKAGLGITSLGNWACRRELEEGSLVPILTDWSMVGTQEHAYFPLGRATRTAARAFINFLLDEFRENVDTAPAG